MQNKILLLASAVVLAFASIVYELLLGQTLSAFLGNTVLRYSVTIGLYMFAMGIGAFLAENKFARDPLLTLLKIELALSAVGGSSVALLYLINPLLEVHLFSLIAHMLIVFIGVLTGFEIPILIDLYKKETASSLP